MDLFGGHSADTFLSEYWQKKPLFVKRAIPDFVSPLSPQELAGLALDETVESRIIMEKGGAYPWELRRGPFTEREFLELPESHWTLLVQEVDQLLSEVADIRQRFRFIPDWRIDDVMISYAAPHGGVGPHIDNYDVFLLQGMGERTWHISERPVEDEQIVEGLDVRMLEGFEGDTTITASPGDLLYLPPRYAHHGIAVDDCLTYSVGFRAPSQKELVAALLEEVLQNVDTNVRYEDPDLTPADQPGEISPAALANIRTMIDSALSTIDLDDWFGQYTTALGPGQVVHPPEDQFDATALHERIGEGISLVRAPDVRMAFIQRDENSATLFAAGTGYETSLEVARFLTGQEQFGPVALRKFSGIDAHLTLLATLIDRGVFRVHE